MEEECLMIVFLTHWFVDSLISYRLVIEVVVAI